VIGGGSIGERHVRCFLNTGRADVALCEINAEIRERLQTEYDLSAVYDNLETALDDKFTAAVICTPAHLHISMAVQLAERGLHILCEKPLSASTAGIDRLAEVLAKQQTLFSLAYVYRAHPVLAELRDAIQSGDYGKPVQLVAVSGQHFPHYRPAYREIYYNNRATGGGAIQDALTHVVNAAEWLIGPISRVVADAEHKVLEGVDVEDTVHVLARHGDVQAVYSLNQHQAANESSITVVCERGTLRFEYHENRWRVQTQPDANWEDHPQPALERDTLFVRQADRFLEVLDGNAKPACSFEEGLQTLKVNLAILKSVDEKRWIEIEP